MRLNKTEDGDTLQHIASKDTQKAVNRTFTIIADAAFKKCNLPLTI